MNFHFLHDARALLLRPLAVWPHVAMIDQLNVINKSAKKSQSRGVGVSVAVKICERPVAAAAARRLSLVGPVGVCHSASRCAPSSLPTNLESERQMLKMRLMAENERGKRGGILHR